MTDVPELDWSLKTVVTATLVAVLGLLLALAVREVGFWPSVPYSEYVFGAVCGATAVHKLHPRRPGLVLFVFVPVLTAMLLVGSVLFYIYVLGSPIEL